MSRRPSLDPVPLPRRDLLRLNLVVNGGISLVIASVLAALVASRATRHHLSGPALAAIIAGAGAVSGALGSFIGVHSGVLERAAGRVADGDGDDVRPGPPAVAVDAAASWRRAGIAALGVGVWAGAVGLILVATLNGRVVGYPVVFLSFVASTVVAATTAGGVAMARGLDAARPAGTVSGQARALRRRAWAEVAPFFAVIIGLAAAGSAWALFHDYTTGSRFAHHALTRSELLRDVLLNVVIFTAGVGFLARRAGEADAALGAVFFDVPDVQRPPVKAPLRRTALGYAGFVVLLAVSVSRVVIPATPPLLVAMLIRGLYVCVLVYVVAGLAYVRGASNGLAARERSGAPGASTNPSGAAVAGAAP